MATELKINCNYQVNSDLQILDIQQTQFDDWFLPSTNELSAMYSNLKAYNVGGFQNLFYWTSSTYLGYDYGLCVSFSNGSVQFTSKSTELKVRACRMFTSSNSYSIRDIGQAGGYIFYIGVINNVTTYFEASPIDFNGFSVWSNVGSLTNLNGNYGSGQGNTIQIISQIGHAASAAKLCNDLIITK